MAIHTAVAQAECDRCWRNQNNVHNNKMVFSADNRVLIKLLRQEKGYNAKKFITTFPSKPWTLSELNKRLPNTGHFTFWGDLRKATVTVVSVDRFNCNLALWLSINDALLMQKLAGIRCCFLKLRKCTQGFTYITPYW